MSILGKDNGPEQGALVLRFAHGAIWNFTGTIAARLCGFSAMVIAARMLGQVGFGELGVLQRTIEFVVTFGSLGVGSTTTKYVAELKNRDPQRTGRIIVLTYLVALGSSGLIALIFILGAPYLATMALNAAHLGQILRLAGLVLLISSVYRLQNGILAGFQSFKSIAWITWWEGLANLLLLAFLIWLAGLWGAALALLLTASLRVIMSSLVLRREYQSFGIHLGLKGVWQEKAALWEFSIPTFLVSTIPPMLLWIAYAMLAHQSEGYANLGLFNAGMQFQWIITLANTIMTMVTVPILAELYGEGQIDRFARSFNSYLKLNWHIAIAGGFLFLGLSPWLIILFGTQFQKSLEVIGPIISFTVIMVAYNISSLPFYSGGKMWYVFIIQIVWGLVLFFSMRMLIPAYGASGLAISMLVAYGTSLVLQLCLMRWAFGSLTVAGILPTTLLCSALIGIGLLFNKLPQSIYYNGILILLSIAIFLNMIRRNWEHIILIIDKYGPFPLKNIVKN